MSEATPDDSRVLSLYRRYIGEPGRAVDVYGGFALFFGGIALGALGLLVYLWSVTLPQSADLVWQLREIAIVLAALGLPAFVLSVVVLLPVSRRAEYVAGLGVMVCLAALGLFIWAYPKQWNVLGGADYSAQGIAVYAGGMAILAGATGSALVAHHIERSSPTPVETTTEADDTTTSTTEGETVTREQVERDIEEAVSNTELTWGGVERKKNTRRLELNTPDVENTVLTDQPAATGTTTRMEGVEDAVAGLRQLQGGGPKEASSESVVDEQTAALRELRERQRAEDGETVGLSDRLKQLFGKE